MRAVLLFLLLLPFACFSQEQKLVLKQDYSFLVNDGEMTTLRQSNDTLYELKCYINRPCISKPAKHYKILSAGMKGDFAILKLERLDTIPLTTDSYPANRYYVLAFKNLTNKQLGYLPLVYAVRKNQLDTIQVDTQSLEDKFFFTYYSTSYLKELSRLKKLSTKEEAAQIMQAVRAEKYNPLVRSYAKTQTNDMYNAGFAAELLTRVCIDNGYNPIGAGMAIEKLLK